MDSTKQEILSRFKAQEDQIARAQVVIKQRNKCIRKLMEIVHDQKAQLEELGKVNLELSAKIIELQEKADQPYWIKGREEDRRYQ